MIVFLIVFGLVASFLFRAMKKGDEELQAICDQCDLAEMFYGMVDDPHMDDQKWREWLPVARFADERFLATHSFMVGKPYGSCERFVLMMVNRNTEEEKRFAVLST